MTLPEKINELKDELDEITFSQLCNYIKKFTINRQRTFLACLSMYINILTIPFSKKDSSGLYDGFVHIRIHLCSRLSFNSAKQYYLYLLDFIYFLQKQERISEIFSPPCKISNENEYETLKSTPIPIEVLEKIKTQDNSQKLTLLIKKYCDPKLEIEINSYMQTLSKEGLLRFRISAISFLSSSGVSFEWNKSRSFIENALTKYNDELILRSPKDFPTSRSLFLSLQNFLNYLIKSGHIPFDVKLKKYQARPGSVLTKERFESHSIKLNNALSQIRKHINNQSYQIIEEAIENLNDSKVQINAANDIRKYIELIKPSTSNLGTAILRENFHIISAHISKNYVLKSAKSRINNLANVLEKTQKKDINLPRLTTEIEYNALINTNIPELIMQKIATKLSSEESLNEALRKYCSNNVSRRLLDYVNSYKPKERKSYRKPLCDFLNQVCDTSKQWEKSPKIIQRELINYRDNLLDELDRSTAYQRYQNTKNALKVLIEHGLLPSNTIIPKNIKISSTVEKYSKNNPLILQVDLKDKENQHNFTSSKEFIKFVQSSLSNNLNQLLEVSKEIIISGYAKFTSKDSVISKYNDVKFSNETHGVISRDQIQSKEGSFDLSSFNKSLLEHKVVYFDYFFDQLIRNEKPHNIQDIKFGTEVLEYFGLTPLVASAMQVVITEELGFNPHSLYEAVISSPNRGEVFILVNDEGSVRVKVYKKRAKHVRNVSAEGNNIPLSQLKSDEIDAASCLKMALEMSERTRKSLNSEHLWSCLLLGAPAGLPWSTTFQGAFNKIRHLAYKKSGSEELKMATLKKVRSSKGVLIYLESQGDTLKATNYLGNQIKTALKNYIPKYLSELIYRVKIRAFQNILLYMSLSDHENQFDILKLSKESYIDQLKHAFRNPDMGGLLFSKLTTQPTNSQKPITTYFCLSQKNVALALIYIKEGKDLFLKSECETVVRKLSEGPTHLKEILRKAQKSLEGRLM